MARITSVEYDKIKQRLLDVGLSSFELKGFNATGLQEIATQASISKGSFYSYFKSKEDFGVGVIQYYTKNSLRSWYSMLEEAIKVKDARLALKSTFIQIIDQYKNSEKKKGCLVGTLSAEISEASELCRLELSISVKAYKELLNQYIKLGQSEGSIRKDVDSNKLAELVWDCWQGSLLRMKIEHSIEPVIDDLELVFQLILSPESN